MHDQFIEQLSDYVDGELSRPARTRLEQHLVECAECSRTVGQIRQVAAWAPTYEGIAPAHDLWPQVESQLSPARSTATRQAGERWFGRRITMRVPHLLAAGIALMLLSAGAMWLARSKQQPLGPEVSGSFPTVSKTWSSYKAAATEKQYDQAVAQLEGILAGSDSILEPGTLKVIRESLATIDRAILDAREAIARDSNNSYLNASIALNMRRKLDILRTAAQAVAAKS